MKAIETRYKGYRFRSRLEARWAVFFDRLELDWQYEPEGFYTPAGTYLPDFFLPQLNLWIEVKSENSKESKDETNAKLLGVVAQTKARGIVVRGDPYLSVSQRDPNYFPGVSDWSAWAIMSCYDDHASLNDAPYVFCVCPICDAIGLEFDGRGERVCKSDHCKPIKRNRAQADALGYWGSLYHGDKAYSWDHPRILEAALAARGARFEHGEAPSLSAR